MSSGLHSACVITDLPRDDRLIKETACLGVWLGDMTKRTNLYKKKKKNIEGITAVAFTEALGSSFRGTQHVIIFDLFTRTLKALPICGLNNSDNIVTPNAALVFTNQKKVDVRLIWSLCHYFRL